MFFFKLQLTIHVQLVNTVERCTMNQDLNSQIQKNRWCPLLSSLPPNGLMDNWINEPTDGVTDWPNNRRTNGSKDRLSHQVMFEPIYWRTNEPTDWRTNRSKTDQPTNDWASYPPSCCNYLGLTGLLQNLHSFITLFTLNYNVVFKK